MMVVVALALAMTSVSIEGPTAHLKALAPDVLDQPNIVEMTHWAEIRLQRVTELRRSRESGTPQADADLSWPLNPAPNFTPFGYHGTSNFVDHDPRFPSLVQDYTCGNRTYDLPSGYNHSGTDYYLWPYPWLMMDEEDVSIVAAAPGVIAYKSDGNFDRDCALGGNTPANAVYIAQDDGLTAQYLHMKSGSLTTKARGERVEAGEFLGFVGSSGSSTGPHLHFELHDADDNVVDPLHGTCNTAPDRWIVPQPYEAPRIDTLTTHFAEPAFPSCGFMDGMAFDDQPNFQDRFAPGATFWAFASYSDQRNGENTHFSVLAPDGSVLTSWDFDLASEGLPHDFYSGTAWDWSVTLPTNATSGTWTLRAEFENAVYEHPFEVAGAAVPGHSQHARPPGEPRG
jgi:hypothetical protein